ncbi:hypothetical protein EXS65_00730 [Candidatus Peribacteria bacterium]|nr:hypothetical protein [Candidatus Peribacteria bacterium]
MRPCTDFLKRHSMIVTATLFGALFFAVQLFFINEYGVSWDEPLHRNWGKIFYLFRRTGDRHFLELMPGHGIHYGPVYYFVNYLLSEKLVSMQMLSFVAANHLLNILTASIAVGFVYALARAVGTKRIAFLSVLFFVFFPPFIAHAHYNPKDIPLMTALLITSFAFIHALKTSSRYSLYVAGFLFGCSIALKVSALLMFPAFACTYFLWLYPQRAKLNLRREFVTVIFGFLAVLAGTILAWPSAWGDLLLIPRSVLFFTHDFWPGKVLFFGQEYSGALLPWYYIPFEYATSMPVLMMLSFFTGLAAFLRLLRRQSVPIPSIFLVLWIFFPLLFSMKPGLVRYDSMRQFFFCLPAIALFAAFGFDALLVRIERHSVHQKKYVIVCLVLLFLSLLHETVILHPFEGSYRNELVRLAVPSAMDHVFQIEYWGSSYQQGMDFLTENAEPNPVICVPTAGILVTWYPWREDFSFECSARSTYVMFFTRYSEAGQYALLPMQPLLTVERMQSELLKIYKVQ